MSSRLHSDFLASLGYRMRPYLKKKQTNKNKTNKNKLGTQRVGEGRKPKEDRGHPVFNRHVDKGFVGFSFISLGLV